MRYFLTSIFTLFASFAFSQHEHHQHEKKDTVPVKHAEHDAGMQMGAMFHSYSRSLPMNRNGSGTSWLPDETPMYMYMTGKKTMWMIHGNVFLRYTNTDLFDKGNRGDDAFDAPNWFMGMVNHPVGAKGLFSAKLMISLDPITEGGNGYPLLFQSGETFNGQPLVDRQHPHDLFSELSIGYSHSFSKDIDAFVYLGYPGEPSIGPPAFMHRISSMNIPNAPLGHHWQDATHITFGVGTLGLRFNQFKVEGSIFTGREPNEDRYDFDSALFDSYSYRLSYNPSKNWAIQFSKAFIESPELLEPGVDVDRTTASVLHSLKTSAGNHWNSAFVWGFNDKGPGHKENSFLLESNFQCGKNAVFGRYEFIEKSTEELDLETEFGEKIFNIHGLSVGYNRTLARGKFVEMITGGMVVLNFPAESLKPLYGNLPLGFQFYFQFRPVLHEHH